MILKLENYEYKRQLVIDLSHCIGYELDTVDDVIILFTPYQQIEIINRQPFYDNWTQFIGNVKAHFDLLIEKQPISPI